VCLLQAQRFQESNTWLTNREQSVVRNISIHTANMIVNTDILALKTALSSNPYVEKL
jgi:hypothetical protein